MKQSSCVLPLVGFLGLVFPGLGYVELPKQELGGIAGLGWINSAVDHGTAPSGEWLVVTQVWLVVTH